MDTELLKTKRWWLHYYKSNNCNQLIACETAGVEPKDVYNWMESDKKEYYFGFNNLDMTFREAMTMTKVCNKIGINKETYLRWLECDVKDKWADGGSVCTFREHMIKKGKREERCIV